MKLSELKHNHSLTDLLKILLFTILMLAPIGMVATRCLYVIANKNAYQSYSNKVETETTNVSLTSSLINGQTYTFNPLSYIGVTTTTNYEILNNQTNIKELYFPDNTNLNTITKIALATSSERTRLIAYNGSYNASVFDITQSFYIVSNGVSETNNQNTAWWTISTLSYTTGKLDNVFEYSVSQLEESSLFNWTENTAIFSGIQTMTTQLGITNQTIPILLVYWFLLTVIYVIIDIILKLFTYMTHAIGSRKA